MDQISSEVSGIADISTSFFLYFIPYILVQYHGINLIESQKAVEANNEVYKGQPLRAQSQVVNSRE